MGFLAGIFIGFFIGFYACYSSIKSEIEYYGYFRFNGKYYYPEEKIK